MCRSSRIRERSLCGLLFCSTAKHSASHLDCCRRGRGSEPLRKNFPELPKFHETFVRGVLQTRLSTCVQAQRRSRPFSPDLARTDRFPTNTLAPKTCAACLKAAGSRRIDRRLFASALYDGQRVKLRPHDPRRWDFCKWLSCFFVRPSSC